jgi:hypothetical protein
MCINLFQEKRRASLYQAGDTRARMIKRLKSDGDTPHLSAGGFALSGGLAGAVRLP